MTITVDVRPEIQPELARQAATRGRALEEHAASLLEDAVHLPAHQRPRRTGQELIDVCARVRGVLTDEIAAQNLDLLFISAVSFGEFRKGITLLSPGNCNRPAEPVFRPRSARHTICC